MIGEQTSKKVGLITLPIIREGTESLETSIRNLMEDGCKIIVADAENVRDLRLIAKAALSLEILPCGSAGLAESISYWLASGSAGRVIVFSGSLNDVTLRQIQKAKEMESIKVVKPNFSGILADKSKYLSEVKRVISEVSTAFSVGKDVIVASAESRDDVSKIRRLAKNLKVSRGDMAEKILSFMGKVASLIVDKFKISGIMIIGGDTAVRIVKSMEASGVIIKEEFLPGVPYGLLFKGKLSGVPVITKAGGFGQEDTIIKSIERLREGS